MRPLRCSLLLIVFILGAISPGRSQTPGSPQSLDKARQEIGSSVMNEITHGEAASVYERFAPDLKDSVSLDDVNAALKELASVAGDFQKQISQTAITVDSSQVYITQSQYEKCKVELHLEFDANNLVTRVWIAPVSGLTVESLESSAKQVANLLQQEQFDRLNSLFDDHLKSEMPAERLDMSWSHVIAHLGQFKMIEKAEKDPEFDVVDVRCQFENGEMIIRVAFAASGKVGGLWMLPAEPDPNGGSPI